MTCPMCRKREPVARVFNPCKNGISMNAKTCLIVCIAPLVALTSLAGIAEGFERETAEPGTAGMSAQKLEQLRADLAKRGTHSLLVIRHDKIVLEWYAQGW